MEYNIVKPREGLAAFIHFYWELKGNQNGEAWERVFPDGCAGIMLNLGNKCLTDNGRFTMEFGKTYVVGAMNSFKDSLITVDTHIVGVCLKPATFANFYSYAPQDELTNHTVELEKSNCFVVGHALDSPFRYFDRFYAGRMQSKTNQLHSVIQDIHDANGLTRIGELAKRNCTTVRQLERDFKRLIGLSPKEYANIIRFQRALFLIKRSDQNRSLLDIAFECGYYDHAHLCLDVKRNTGLSPSLL
ncbi:helix-turn-helix domain-containing protein [Sphingobacterium griseoflavum]|uniref:HTH araC/xylS-type domain-containing protein n=1 Tax=Sphingobacterium griseoflavum TaxID=1474952 RepID=A0ABQ3HSG0_9SPHI|nr:helix-turn-helix domain-containing protein [Sphingobacterium griseoflavum]GHE30478.1 hypothetical protein GCM10017764_11740 [Sphingobacterium griseoflavum]